MRDALEEEPNFASRVFRTQGPQLDFHVPVAAEWILIAGRQLFLCKDDYSSKRILSIRLWKGKHAFSKERWQLWARRFEEIGECEQVAPRTREVAKEAAGMMKRVEEVKKENGVSSSRLWSFIEEI